MAANLLVVEDEEAIASTLREVLLSEGYRVEAAGSHEEAVSQTLRHTFDLALLDLRLGDESGLSVLAHLKQASPDTVALVLTGYGSLDTAVQAMRDGAIDYLLKPCDVRELKAAVARGLEQRERNRLLREADDELNRAVRRHDELLALAAHELRTPLSVVVGWAQYLQRQLAQGTSDLPAEKLDMLVAQARRLARLVDDFIDLLRVQNGSIELNLAAVDICALAERAVGQAKDGYQAARFVLERPAEPALVLGDAERLSQALGKLLNHAIKFAPAGEPIRVSVLCDETEVRVAVQDHGLGMSPENAEAIFDETERARRPELGRRISAFGLNLYLARVLVEAHDGHIHADSRGRNRDSTITVALPRAN